MDLLCLPIRIEGPGGVYQRHQAAGGGLPRARRLLVSVCGLEPPGDLQEQEGLCAHSLWVLGDFLVLGEHRQDLKGWRGVGHARCFCRICVTDSRTLSELSLPLLNYSSKVAHEVFDNLLWSITSKSFWPRMPPRLPGKNRSWEKETHANGFCCSPSMAKFKGALMGRVEQWLFAVLSSESAKIRH